jgi:DNA-binding CsgD family transcriptional regulator
MSEAFVGLTDTKVSADADLTLRRLTEGGFTEWALRSWLVDRHGVLTVVFSIPNARKPTLAGVDLVPSDSRQSDWDIFGWRVTDTGTSARWHIAHHHGQIGANELSSWCLHAVREASIGYLPSSASEAGPTVRPGDLHGLSRREIEVLEHLAGAIGTAEIAAEMHVSVNTVRAYIRSILRKLSVDRRNAAVTRARELQILAPTERTAERSRADNP